MVWLHVVDDKVIQFAAGEYTFHILKELLGDGGIGGVEQHGLLVKEQVAVIGSAAGDGVDVFKQSELTVAGTYIIEIVGDFT